MLDYAFMRDAFLAATVVAVVAGATGFFLVLRGQTFAGHALAHVGFTGATGAVLVGIAPLWGMVAVTVGAGLGMGLLGERWTQRDVAIGMVLAMALGLGMLFLHFYTSFASEATSLLFGNVLAVSAGTVWMLAALGSAALAALAVISRPLLFASLQPELAEARGVSTRLYASLFLVVVAVAAAATAQIVGVLLVFALMVGPAATAQRLTSRIGAGVLLSVALAVIESWAGITLAYYTDWPTSFGIVAASGLAFLATALPRPNHRFGRGSRQRAS